VNASGLFLLLTIVLAVDAPGAAALMAGVDVAGRMSHAVSGAPLAGVRVRRGSTGQVVITSASGDYRFGDVSPGRHQVFADADGFVPIAIGVRVEIAPVLVDVALDRLGRSCRTAANPAG